MSDIDVVGCSSAPCEVDAPDLHPITTIAVEWNAPFAWSPAWATLWRDHGGYAVHAWHAFEVHRNASTPLRCRLSAEVVGQRSTRAGALTVVRYDAADADGPLWTTRAGVLWRGLSTTDRGDAVAPVIETPDGDVASVQVPVAAGYALEYSEASGIWNPVHTDPDAARAAGLDAPILHGSATLGLALAAAAHEGTWRRVSARFLAAVTPPDVLTVVSDRQGDLVRITASRSDGIAVLAATAEHRANTRGAAE